MNKKPFVGEDVLFQPRGIDGAPLPQKEAAKVVHIWNDECVNLVVWNASGCSRAETSVPLGEGAGRWNRRT